MKGGNGVRKANVVTLRRAWLRKRPKKTHALVRKVLKSMRSLRPLRLKNLRRTSVCDTVWFSPDVAVRERDKATNGSGVWILARQRGLGAAPRRGGQHVRDPAGRRGFPRSRRFLEASAASVHQMITLRTS